MNTIMIAQQVVIIAENGHSISSCLRHHLEHWGYLVESVNTVPNLRRYLQSQSPALIILDLNFQGDGLGTFSKARAIQPNLPVVMLAEQGRIDTAISAMRMGARDYITLPLNVERLQSIMSDIAANSQTQQSSAREVDGHGSLMIGESEPMQRVRNLIEEVAQTDAAVLILGESGTGKELVARHIHALSQRPGRFVPVNIASLAPTLIESGLFGHEKGSFTGADRTHKGWCELADEGTLFLDEIGEMDLLLQPKLLRFLQEQTVERVGAGQSIELNTRIVAATNRDLNEMVRMGQLRKDLYYRLCVFPIELPPLRERMEDIPALALGLLRKTARRVGKSISSLSAETIEAFMEYDWPGNIRQLENVIHRMVILCRETELSFDLLPIELQSTFLVGNLQGHGEFKQDSHGHASGANRKGNTAANGTQLLDAPRALSAMEQIEKRAILNALERSNMHVIKASLLLGLGQATLYRKIKRFGINL